MHHEPTQYGNEKATGLSAMTAQKLPPGLDVTSTCGLAGEKLSESTAADVRELCSTLLNCYLIQVTFKLLARIQHNNMHFALLPSGPGAL